MPKISELNAITSVANTDLLMVVHDPGGSPSTNKITVNNFISVISQRVSLQAASGNNGFLPVSTGSNTYTWKANPDVRSYQLITSNYQATLDDSILTVDPSVNLSSITILLPNTAPNGKVFGVENKYNFGGESYIVMVKKTDLSNTIQHPVTSEMVSTVSMPYSSEGYFWVYQDGDYRILHNMHNSDVFYSSANNYSEVAIQNINSGVEASADLVIYNDAGDYDVGNGPFIDLGLNSSQYNTSVFGSIWEPNDGYLYNSGGTLLIGTAENNSIKFFAGNTNAENIIMTLNTSSISVNTVFQAPQSTKANNSVGVAGQISWDSNNIYVCVGTNSWKKVSLSDF